MEEFKGRDKAFLSDWLTKKDAKSWGQTDKSDVRVEHLNTILARGGENLNDPIFKSSNARALPGAGGGGMLKFRVDQCIMTRLMKT